MKAGGWLKAGGMKWGEREGSQEITRGMRRQGAFQAKQLAHVKVHRSVGTWAMQRGTHGDTAR